eukprot:3760552-Pyramimonas_sp.AAC.1
MPFSGYQPHLFVSGPRGRRRQSRWEAKLARLHARAASRPASVDAPSEVNAPISNASCAEVIFRLPPILSRSFYVCSLLLHCPFTVSIHLAFRPSLDAATHLGARALTAERICAIALRNSSALAELRDARAQTGQVATRL